jgi:hypothetical protein
MSQIVPILKKKHNRSNKNVSFGQTLVQQVSPYKEENRENTITKKELENAKQEVRLEKIVNKVHKIKEEEEKKKWDEDIEQRKKEYVDFLKKNKEKYNDFLKIYEENRKYNTKRYDFGGNPMIQTRKIGKNKKTYKHKNKTGVSTRKNNRK